MRKFLILFATLLATGTLMAQHIVSTQVQKRNVLLEEFTGYNCGWCPDGHAIANEICDQYAGHAWAINIHAGSFANGSGYTTPAGNAIHSDWGSAISGYPCGTVNRSSIQGRGEWAASAANIRQQDAIVNIAAQGTVDVATRTVTMRIEAYYTGNSSSATNYFNVAVVQNNILGYQSNYGNLNPDYIEGDQYRHMHMLRDLLVGNWGVAIPTTQGNYFDTTITYTIPASINGLAVDDINDLEFIAFITENHRNVLNAQKVFIPESTPNLTKLTAEQPDACVLEYTFTATVVNNTTENVTSVTLNIDGSNQTFNVNIPSSTSAEIALPRQTIALSGAPVQNCASTKSVSLVSATTAGGQTMTVNGAAKRVSFAEYNIYTTAGPFTVRCGVDAYASETGLQLIEQDNYCHLLWQAAPSSYNDISTSGIQYISDLPDARFFEVNFNPDHVGLYILRATDSYGDGWTYTNNDNPSGVWLSNASGQIFADEWGYSNGSAFSHKDYYLNVTAAGDGSHTASNATVGIDETMSINTTVYPNPVTNILHVDAPALREISLLDLNGRILTTVKGNSVDMSNFSAGVYFVRVITDNGTATKKIVKE